LICKKFQVSSADAKASAFAKAMADKLADKLADKPADKDFKSHISYFKFQILGLARHPGKAVLLAAAIGLG
jgi:hypothetical protein